MIQIYISPSEMSFQSIKARYSSYIISAIAEPCYTLGRVRWSCSIMDTGRKLDQKTMQKIIGGKPKTKLTIKRFWVWIWLVAAARTGIESQWDKLTSVLPAKREGVEMCLIRGGKEEALAYSMSVAMWPRCSRSPPTLTPRQLVRRIWSTAPSCYDVLIMIEWYQFRESIFV